jgi:hypothetical protein
LIPAFAWETDRLPVGCTLGGAGVERRLGLLMRRFGAVDGGMDDDVTDVEILVGGLGSEAQKIVGELLPAVRRTPANRRSPRKTTSTRFWTGMRPESSKDNEHYQS